MNIGISTTTINSCLTQKNPDGIGVYTQNLIAELQKIGVVITGYNNLSFKNWLKIGGRHTSPPHLLMPPTITCSISALLGFPHLQHRQIEKEIKLYHATDYKLLKLTKTPIVANLHDAILLKSEAYSSLKFRTLPSWVLKRLARYADSIITASHAMVPDLVEHWKVTLDRIQVIPNGISSEWFAILSEQEKHQVLNKYQLRPGYLLFVGTLQPRKNLLRLMDAFSHLPFALQLEHPLIIAGKVGWKYDEIIEKMNRLVARRVCSWLNYVPQTDIRALYQCANAIVYPSLAEGFGLPVLEAFASHTPLISSNIEAIAEIASDAALLVNPLDTEAIQDAIVQVLQKPALANQLRQKGYQRAQTMTWTRCAENTLKVYQQLI